MTLSTDKKLLFDTIRESIIGEGSFVDGPYGKKLQTYVDYTASGKALKFIEDYISKTVLPLYANTHTESSYTGAQTNILREEARNLIKGAIHATEDHALIFTGHGVTGAIAKLISVMGLKNTNVHPVVFVGPYEHHSNELMWREVDAEVVRIKETEDGMIDLLHLERELKERENNQTIKIGSFSAASNVTGIITNTTGLCTLMHKFGGLCFLDCATAGPYLPICMTNTVSTHDAPDAVFLSPHKFLGGPGTPGILVAKRELFTNTVPTIPGGGTVLFTSPTDQVYESDIEAREEAGTPDIIGAIRAGLVFQVKKQVGEELIHTTETTYARRAIEAWSKIPNRLAIISFVVYHEGRAFHHNFISILLSDLFGLQVRSGCSCAGPYGHSLLKVDEEASQAFKSRILEGYLGIKPGWVRLNFPYWITEKEFQFILDAVSYVATNAHLFIGSYNFVIEKGSWHHKHFVRSFTHLNTFELAKQQNQKVILSRTKKEKLKESYFQMAKESAKTSHKNKVEIGVILLPLSFEQIRWFWLPHELVNVEKSTLEMHRGHNRRNLFNFLR